MARKKRKPPRRRPRRGRGTSANRQRSSSSRSSAHRDNKMFEDMRYLFPGDPSSWENTGEEVLLEALAFSGEMANEPEFKDITVDPLLCVETFTTITEELGVEPNVFDGSSEEHQDLLISILARMVQHLLTEELRHDIIHGLEQARSRWRRSRDRKNAATAAVVQSFLQSDPDGDTWSIVGLVQAIIHRNLIVGFELIQTTTEMLEIDASDGEITDVLEKMDQPHLKQKISALLDKIPRLNQFLENQVDNAWEEGINALFMGDLYLGLYSPEEIDQAAEILQPIFRAIVDKGETVQDDPEFKKQAKAVFSQLDNYLTSLFTPERQDRLRSKLTDLTKDEAYQGQWLPFLLIVQRVMSAEDAIENEKPFLTRALLGEIRAISKEADVSGESPPAT